MRKLIIATKNKGKVKEIKALLADLPFEVLSLEDAGIHQDIVEDGHTFEENSLIKARAIHQLTGQMVLADDSGLEVDYLNGAPGIYSARFLGAEVSDKDRYQGILTMLEGVPENERTARFVCVASIIGSEIAITERGELEGLIAEEPSGDHGFGYDPIFFVPEYKKTVAELDDTVKNRISHRGKAFLKVAEHLKILLK